uniref:Importin N-terminal domain-containing protein n=1 Tax=Cryptomonas curvata TaxID=233186 RepID=A0A7S0QT70_9CRYP|mmetsp:Transcript_54521/g.113873  ORF Transcript_54521/g.113873 Transcript_54521/m.113873 type:complete len:731 (+) Transcript_54521:127-2319(+)
MNAAILRQILGGAQSPDPATRNAAEEQLKQSFLTDPATHLTLLGNELADEAAPSIQTRQLAGLLLKNCMTSKDHAQAVKLANDWMGLDPQARTQIKSCSVQSLGSSHKDVRLASAQVISKIATIELPKRDATGCSQWEDLMPALLQWVVQPEASQAGMAKKEAALNTIGYICEEIADLETDCLQAKSNEILTAVVAGMRTEETDQNVKLAAVKALNNALEFASKNFDVDTERNYILQVICEACTHGSDEVKEYAYQCLSRIAELYYEKLPMYIQAILEMTLSAIQKESDAVARQAITFWTTVCDVEYDMLNSDEGESKCKKFIKGAHKFLVPVLLVAMTTQEEDQDADTFNKSTEAAVCLQSIATTINEEILDTVMPWVQTNISQANWRLREAAVMACGCVLEGPAADRLHDFVSRLVETLVLYLNDTQQICKDTSAWTLRQVCQHVPTAINKQVIGRLCETIMQAIPGSEPCTAEHLCTAVMSLAKFVKEQLLELSGDSWPIVPNEFSPVVVALAQCFIATADRPDATEANLRQASYETLNSVIEVADNQTIESFVAPQLLPLLGERLTATFQMQALNVDDANTKSEWQSIYCGTLQVCIGRLPYTFLTVADSSGSTLVDKFMGLFLQVFSMQNTTSAQDALLAIGSVCNQLPDGGFERYMQHFAPLLVQCINAVGDARLSVLAITITADVSRALEGKLAAFSDPIVEALLIVHSNPAVDAEIHQVKGY